MSDAAPSLQSPDALADAPQQGLTPEEIERVLADFRDWLGDLTPADEPPEPESFVDLHTLVGQFTSLRQEVNLQTKATRSALEQNAALLEQNAATLGQLEETLDDLRTQADSTPKTDEAVKPVLKTIIDVYDALALALKQVARQREAIRDSFREIEESYAVEPLPELALTAPAAAPPPRGLWSRLLGGSQAPVSSDDPRRILDEWYERVSAEQQRKREKAAASSAFFLQALDGLVTGYNMSLNRIDRLLPQVSLEPMSCLGQPFDPETMEAVEVVSAGGRSGGEVVEEVRRGYRRQGQIYRYAQVRVAK